MNSSIEQRVRNANAVAGDDSLDELFGDDLAARLLADVQSEGKGRMAETTETTTVPQGVGPDPVGGDRGSREKSGSHQRWRIAAAAAAVVVVGGAVLGSLWLGSEGRTAARNVSVAADMLDAYYSADPGFVAYFEGEEVATEYTRWDYWFFGLEQTAEFDCTHADVDIETVTCDVTSQNTLSSLAGIPPAFESVTFQVSDGLIVAVDRRGGPTVGELPGLIEAEVRWINRQRPAIWEASFSTECEYEETTDCLYWPNSGPPFLATTENARVMIELAPEFFAGNRVWPING